MLIDAANEHELLLELCRDLGVRTVLETHGHWDHIQAVPAVRDAGYEVGITAEDSDMLDAYDYVVADDSVIEVGRLRLHTIHTPGPHPGLDVLPDRGLARAVQRRHAVPRRAGQHQLPQRRLRHDHRQSIDRRLFAPLDPDTIVLPGHGDQTTIGTERPHLQEWVDRGW